MAIRFASRIITGFVRFSSLIKSAPTAFRVSPTKYLLSAGLRCRPGGADVCLCAGQRETSAQRELLTASVPTSLLPKGLEFKPVELSPAEYYPALAEFVQRESLEAARSKLANSQAALQAAVNNLTNPQPVKAEQTGTDQTGEKSEEDKPDEKVYPQQSDAIDATRQVAVDALGLKAGSFSDCASIPQDSQPQLRLMQKHWGRQRGGRSGNCRRLSRTCRRKGKIGSDQS